jgi:oxygen-dependent protoporphyrinogen oxidase
MTRVAVIGAGISGLVAAYELSRMGADVIVLESSSRPGGVIGTRSVGGYQFEIGPSCIQGESGALRELIDDLRMTEDILPADPSSKYRHLYYHGSLKALPTNMAEFGRSRLFSPQQKLRILMEPLIHRRKSRGEVSVAEFFGRRLGRGVSMTWVDVLVSEVYAGNPNRLGIDSAFPTLASVVRENGGFLRAMRSQASTLQNLEESGVNASVFSLKEGLESLPKRLAAELGDRIRYARVAKQLARRPGGGLQISVGDHKGNYETLEADRLVTAIDAAHTGVLLAPLAPDVADLLFEVETSPLMVALAGFDRDQLPGLPPGFGFLVPRCVRMRTLGWRFLSNLFPNRAPEGKIALLGFIGGVLDPHATNIADDVLKHLMMGELALALGQRKMPRPEHFEILRWEGCLPQYNVGHLRRIQAVRTFVAMESPEVTLAGNWVSGISVNSCVRRGREAAKEALAPLSDGGT